MPDSSLDTHLRNLNAQIKYNQVGIASWGGQKQFKKSELPTVDFLLNNASKITNQQNLRAKMVDEYLKKERVPIVDPETGRSYKYHNIPDPVLNLDDIDITFTNPLTGARNNFILTPEDFESFVANKEKTIFDVKKRARDAVDDISNEITKLQRDKKTKELELKILKGEQDELEKQLRDPGRLIQEVKDEYKRNVQLEEGARKKRTKQQAAILRRNLDRVEINLDAMARELDNIKEQIDETQDEIIDLDDRIDQLQEDLRDVQRNLDQTLEEVEITVANIQNRIKGNKKIIGEYQNELNKMNSGAFNTTQQPNESEQDYLERLRRMADVPFDDNNSQQLAIMDQKTQLKENLLNIIRERSLIEGVVNALQNINYLDIFTLNKTFELFKTKFLKKYGFDNKNLELIDIVDEIDKFIKKLDELPPEQNQLVVFGNPQQQQQQQEEEDLGTTRSFNPPFPLSSDFFSRQPSKSESESILNQFVDSDEEEDVEDVPISSSSVPNNVVFITPELEGLVSNPYTLQIISKINGEPIYFRYKIGTPENKLKYDTFIDKSGELFQKGNKDARTSIVFEKKILLYSFSGNKGTFKNFNKLSSSSPYTIISERLGLGEQDLFKIFSISSGKNKANVVQDFLNKMIEIGIQPSPETGYIITRESKSSGIVGEGLEKENKDKKVKFGDIVIMPNKLFYDNVLSISRPDGVKINGFKNKRVSDDFVVLVVKLLQKRDDYIRELNKLSSVERVLLDNLLSVANLHKKIITGSGNDSINKLKNELQILEGQIQAGNNNESLKKKLHDILHKLAYFKVISLSQATKHYKDYIKNFF